MKTVNLTVSMTWRVADSVSNHVLEDVCVEFPSGEPVLYTSKGKPLPASKVEFVGHATETVDIDDYDQTEEAE